MDMKTHLSSKVLRISFVPFLAILSVNSLSAQVKISEQDWVIPTYAVAPADKNPMFFERESYQGASKFIYPYAMNDVISDEKKDRAWKTVTLENEFIKLCVTPEIGGKLYYASDKSNGYNFVYRNNVVKPSNIGMLGAWVSGGIEWCVLHHHRASTFQTVDYTTSENSDGSKTIWIGETEPRHRMRWTIGITAFPGRSYFEAQVKIVNPTPYTNTFLYWANVAAHTNENYQVIFPPSVNIATYHAKNSFTHWPYSTEVYNGQDFTRGVDISWWKNSPGSNSFFAWDLKEDFMGGYDHGKETGTVHIGDHNIIKGAKLWEWGSGAAGQATEARLTDNDGPYVEIMVGAFSDNQPDYSWIRPYEVKTFKQYWYPVKDIQGFKNANLNGAVNLEAREKNQIFLGYCTTRKVNKAEIRLIKNGNEVIFSKTISISPDNAFTSIIRMEGQFAITDLYTELKDSETGEILISYKPVEYKKAGKLPDIVKRPPLPKDIETVEELYLAGSRIGQFYNPALNAIDYYEEALRHDPSDIRTNTAIGNIYLKNGDYLIARNYFSKAIRRLTKDYTRPSTCEALYLQGLTLKAMGLYDEAVDTLYRATWDYAYHSAAYFELARISTSKLDFDKALEQVNESLSTNSRNNSAIELKSSILRHTGKFKEAFEALADLPEGDPLDFRAGNEKYLILKGSGENLNAEKFLSDLKSGMRDFDQNYLELGISYLDDGLTDEAEDVFSRFSGKNPEILYYLGYIEDKKGKKAEAQRLFSKGSELPTDYVFPFRLETVNILKKVSEYRPEDAKPWYYLGNLLYDKQPDKAIEDWENAVKLDPSVAIAHRNLGWGYYHHQGDGLKAIASYEKAISIKKDEPVYYEELDALYEMSNSPVEKRLALFDGNNEVVSKRDDAFARQIKVLTLAGESEKAVEYLAGRKFNYREGSSRVRDIIIDAHLMLGKKYLSEKKYDKALTEFILAQVPEEEAGESRAGNRNIQVYYFTGLAYEATGNRSKAKKYYVLSTTPESGNSSYIKYYQGLSYLKLGKKAEADNAFNAIISEGERQISQSVSNESDFFAKFGTREAENARLSNAFMLKGLGYKGLGKTVEARENLQKAVELSAGNLYAAMELRDL
jgi:tetratricopeptide (TPR) repeat protein